MKLRMTFVYRVNRFFARLFFRWYLPARTEGLENVPAQGPVLLAANHTSALDAPLVGIWLSRPVAYLARNSLWGHSRLFDWWLNQCNALPIDQDKPDVQSFKNMLRILQSGGVLVVFPEGVRSWEGKMEEARPGIGRLACKTGAPVVPIHIEGAYEVLPRGSKKLKRHPVRIRFGTPLQYPDVAVGQERLAHFKGVTADIMRTVSELETSG